MTYPLWTYTTNPEWEDTSGGMDRVRIFARADCKTHDLEVGFLEGDSYYWTAWIKGFPHDENIPDVLERSEWGYDYDTLEEAVTACEIFAASGLLT